jgi:hypothetical protein
MKHAENAGLTDRRPKQTVDEMLVAVGDCLKDVAGSDKGEDGEDKDDEEAEQGKLSDDDEPGWVMGTISKTEQQLMERFRQKPMKLDKLTQPGREDTANYFHETYKK